MDTTRVLTFRPGPDADLLDALAITLRTSRNEVLRQGLHALARENQPRTGEALELLAKFKEES